MTDALVFPPLIHGEPARDPLAHAQMRAVQGCDAGLIAYDLGADRIRAALVLAPEVPLSQAMAMLPLCGVGFQNALGALAPPEVAVHLDWDGGIRVNGASCGRLQALASGSDPAQVPDWLIIALDLPLWPDSDAPGDTPDRTALYAEGCADVAAPLLVEAWARHTLAGLRRWEDDGVGPLHAEWRALAWNIGEPITIAGKSGTFLGVDEGFGLLLRHAGGTDLVPLTTLLETDP
ncbi:MAG: DUF4444 domain-containing protein [Marinibacterium sp.]|nr:DUF4444 domain-containing protein [Marinibacterium sp.]